MDIKIWLFFNVLFFFITCNCSETLNSTQNVNASNIAQGKDTDYKKDKRAWDIGLTIGFSTAAIISIVGNSIVIHVVRTTRSMQTSVNLYIANMALSDIISTVFCMPLSLQSLYSFDSWLQGTVGLILCKLVYIMFYTSFACSTFNLVAVAFDRYLAVIKPFYRYPAIVVKCILPFIWITSIVISLPIASSYSNKYKPLRDEKYTICLDLERDNGYVVGVTIMTLLCYVLPLAIASTLYAMTGRKLCKRSKMSIASRSDRTKEQARRTAMKATKLMVTVIAIFSLCWAPFFIYHMAKAWYEGNLNEELEWVYRPLCFLFASINGVINPLLYGSFSGNFRYGIKSILLCDSNKVRRINTLPQARQNHMKMAHKPTYS
ncbi:allatostatin-A receptor-like [Actinia tenebrosa]|uniref:Allatostatin-A receptor-like n=1 Tax=Actinia tenebrosa TaxID=6105 RepID=A0A6P8J053_ACTTE|nr:allatostatin-A receptor-like [Actinia tenebrosa]